MTERIIGQIDCVIPTLNAALTLEQTLLSLRSQRDVEVTIRVVDSGSTDGTLDICKRWGVTTLYAPPGNMYQAINIGLTECLSPWLAYLNADDWLFPDSFARLMRLGEASEAGVIYGNCDYVDSMGRFVSSFQSASPSHLAALFGRRVMGFSQPAAIFRREVYTRLIGFDEQYRLVADADFYLRALCGGIRFAFLEGAPVACFRLHTQQKSRVHPNERLSVDCLKSRRPANEVHDWRGLAAWRLQNGLHYALRILRVLTLYRKLRMPRAMDIYE